MGGCKCTFRTCSVSTQKFPSMSFFHYPVNKKDRLEQWVQHTKFDLIQTLDSKQARNRAVCGLHFRDECFMNYKKNRLTPMAVPTLDRLKTGQVLDYTLAENPKPITLPPTKLEHLIAPKDILVWGHKQEFWFTFSTISKPKKPVDDNDCTAEPVTKKIKIIETYKTPRILNKGIRLLSNISLDENFEIDENTTVSSGEDVFPQNEESVGGTVPVMETIHLDEENSCHTTDHTNYSNTDNIVNIDDVEFLTVDPQDSVTLADTCKAYDDEIALLKNEMEKREMEAKKDIALLKAALENAKEKLQQSGSIAKALKLKVNECEQKVADLETKNQELLLAKAAEPIPVVPVKPIATSSSSLSKPQLFNGIKKYLSASMTALVRMEMFGNSERQWKPDEKQVSVELLKLGENVYKYFRDEWRFRLPPQKMVDQWTTEVTDEDIEDL